eukprot:scaffold1305_cov248-Pinguiococcus_pyrenoidosus.AAC.1
MKIASLQTVVCRPKGGTSGIPMGSSRSASCKGAASRPAKPKAKVAVKRSCRWAAMVRGRCGLPVPCKQRKADSFGNGGRALK